VAGAERQRGKGERAAGRGAAVSRCLERRQWRAKGGLLRGGEMAPAKDGGERKGQRGSGRKGHRGGGCGVDSTVGVEEERHSSRNREEVSEEGASD
jgi:hypothetical protein